MSHTRSVSEDSGGTVKGFRFDFQAIAGAAEHAVVFDGVFVTMQMCIGRSATWHQFMEDTSRKPLEVAETSMLLDSF